jgi:hypothetical protein
VNATSIYPLYQSNCTEIIVMSLHNASTTLNYASFTFLKVGDSWYRLSFVDEQLKCTIDDPGSIRYANIEEDSCVRKSTNITALFPLASNRITDIYVEHVDNLIQANISFLIGRLGLSHNIDTGKTRLLVLN